MRTLWRLSSLVWLALLAAVAWGEETPSLTEKLAGQCATCHRQMARGLTASAHANIPLHCTDCHGGNPNADEQEQAHAASTGFKGDRSKVEIIRLCAGCHADPERMRASGLPVEQYERYQTSQHGKALAQGNTDVAICTDCHSAHAILPAKDPESTVHPTQLPKTCANCHADAQLMKRHGLPTDQYEQYVGSVHGKAVLEKGTPGAPTCASCHGNHGAAPPGHADVSTVCGNCHPNTRKQFITGPHKEGMDKQDLAECSSCHSNHGIQKTSVAMLTEMCDECHTPSSAEYRRGATLRGAIEETASTLSAQAAAVAAAKKRALSVEALEGKLQTARTDLLRSAVVQHRLSVREVDKSLKKVRAASDEVAEALEEIEGRIRGRKLSVLYIWGFFLWAGGLLVIKRVRTRDAPVGAPSEYEHAGAGLEE